MINDPKHKDGRDLCDAALFVSCGSVLMNFQLDCPVVPVSLFFFLFLWCRVARSYDSLITHCHENHDRAKYLDCGVFNQHA